MDFLFSPSTTRRLATGGAASVLMLVSSLSWASFQIPPKDKVEAPSFVLDKPSDLPLQATRHAVEVVGPVAYVRLTQVYKNTGSALLNATYVFPGSTRSAVSSLVMRVGKRTIHAELKKKEAAREAFEAAKREGYRASLLEQKRPNVFSMELTNLRPGETVEVELGYTELLEPEGGQYELVLPAVVAPRYGGKPEGIGERPTVDPQSDKRPSWTANVHIRDGLNISEVTSPTVSELEPRMDSEGRVRVQVSTQGNKDFVLRWRVLPETKPDAGLVLYEGPKENFFMMTIAPPKVVDADSVPAREMVFVLDVSGSMSGYPLDVAKEVMRESLKRLRPTDRFNILFFAGSSWRFSDKPLKATAENIERALADVSKRQGGGGTELVRALSSVAELPRAKGLARTIVVVTDGLVAFEKSAFSKVREKLQESTLFTLGIGTSINRMLVEGLARAGGGVSYVAYNKEGAAEEARRLATALRAPVLTDINLAIDGLDAYDLEPPAISDLYADRPIVVVGKYRGPAKGKLSLHAHARNSSFQKVLDVAAVKAQVSHQPLRVLWARRKLQRVADDRTLAEGGADKEAITNLGLKYGLLTDYTSFVAIDSEGGKASGPQQTVVQPGPADMNMAVPKRVVMSQSRLAGGQRGGVMAAEPPGYVEFKGTMLKRRKPMAQPSRSPAVEEIADDKLDLKEEASKLSPVRVQVLPPVVIEGAWKSSEIKAQAQLMVPRLTQLAQKILGDGPELAVERRITFDLMIDNSGAVIGVKVVTDQLGSPALREAWEKEFLKLQFKSKTGRIRLSLRATRAV